MKPRFKIDENLPDEVRDFFQSAGFDCQTVGDQGLSGSADEDLIEVCRGEARAMVTLDLDFADIRTYPPAAYAGIIVLRPRRASVGVVIELLRRVVPMLETEAIQGRLWICDPSGVRIRGDAS